MKNILIIIFAFISVYLYWNGLSKDKSFNKAMEAINSDLVEYKTKYGQAVVSAQTLEADKSILKYQSDSLKEIIDNFKEPEVIIKYKWKIKTDTLEVPIYINDSIPGYLFDYSSQWMALSGQVLDQSIKFNPIEIYNTQNAVTGYKKKNVFSSKSYYVDITNTNPYLQQQQIQTIKIDNKKSFHEKWWVTIPIGLLGGALIFN